MVGVAALAAIAWVVLGRAGPAPPTSAVTPGGALAAPPASDIAPSGSPAAAPSAAREPVELARRVAPDDAERLLADFPEPARSAARAIAAVYPQIASPRVPPQVAGWIAPRALPLRCDVLSLASDRVRVLHRDDAPELGIARGEVGWLWLDDPDPVRAAKARWGCAGTPHLVVGAVQTLLVVGTDRRRCALASPPDGDAAPRRPEPTPTVADLPAPLQAPAREVLAQYPAPAPDARRGPSRDVISDLVSAYLGTNAPRAAALVRGDVVRVGWWGAEVLYRSDAPDLSVVAGQRESVAHSRRPFRDLLDRYGLPTDDVVRPGKDQLLLVVADRMGGHDIVHGIVLAAPAPR